jgi:hypothetical protein
MVVCEDQDTFNHFLKRPQDRRGTDYVFYFGSISLYLQAWASLEAVFASSLPLVAITGYIAAPVLGLQNKDALRTKNDVVNVSSAITQVQVV